MNDVVYEVGNGYTLTHWGGASSYGSFGSFTSSVVSFFPTSLPEAVPPFLPPSPMPAPPPLVPPGIVEIVGCMDPAASNYNPSATRADTSCMYEISACTDSTAWNYVPSANVDDGSCEFEVFGCTVSAQLLALSPDRCTYLPAICTTTLSDGESHVCSFPRCARLQSPLFANYDSLANSAGPTSCRDPVVLGCTDSTKLNYMMFATVDDNSCVEWIPGCQNPLSSNYNPSATTPDPDNPCAVANFGCTDPMAINYEPAATAEHPDPYYGCR
jgi:hypothetical protein